MDGARDVLSRCLQEAEVPAVWTEWCTDDPSCPEDRQRLGSPTILVNGKDVAPGPHPWAPRHVEEGPRCRLYDDDGTTTGAPPYRLVLRAVLRALEPDVI